MNIQPQGEMLRKAVKYISEEKQANPEASMSMLIQKACVKFDLTPKDAVFLDQFYKNPGSKKVGL